MILQLLNRYDLHSQLKPEVRDRRFTEFVKKGKPEKDFDFTWMGLDMLMLPTMHFGYQGVTATMKKESFFLFP